MSIRELMIEYILFAFTDEELMSKFQVTEEEVSQLCDMDLLEMYDQTLLTPVTEQLNKFVGQSYKPTDF